MEKKTQTKTKTNTNFFKNLVLTIWHNVCSGNIIRHCGENIQASAATCHCKVQFNNMNSFFPFLLLPPASWKKYPKAPSTAEYLTSITDENKALEVYKEC